MHIEFLVEEESAEIALQHLVPKITEKEISFRIHVFQGKHDLINKLPSRLNGYLPWLPYDWIIMVLLDEDREDCGKLKGKLERIASMAGLKTKSQAGLEEKFQVINRLAIEELEAWFFGDVAAICQAYHRIPSTIDRRRGLRDPDAILGGTWEALERIMQTAGYYAGGLPKKEVAREVSKYMDPDRNRSKSFQVFRDSLRSLRD
jgi:hypothetical protein